jgi:hypothetical protein
MEENFAICLLDEGLIYKELQKLNTKRTRNLSNK